MATPNIETKKFDHWSERWRHSLIKSSSIIDIEQHYIVAGNLAQSSVVVDLGANRGRFVRDIRARFGCRVVAIEPEAGNFASIPADESVTKIQAAVGGSCGFITIHLAEDSTAHSIVAGEAHAATGRTQKVRMLDFTALAAEAGLSHIDFLKVDIEGCEWDFFDSMSNDQFATIGQIAVEFHDFVPEYRDRVRTWPVYQRLMRLGFHCVEDPTFGSYNVLFVNRRFGFKRRSDAVRITLLHLILRLRWKIDRLQHLLKKACSRFCGSR